MYVIYVLVDPRDNSVFYVGITEDVYHRFLEHINCSGTNFGKNARIVELRATNKMVIMETLEEVESRGAALQRETYWIHHFEALREPIANISKTSPSRRAKKTGIRLGRFSNIEIASTQTARAVDSVYSDQIDNYQEVVVETAQASTIVNTQSVSDEKRHMIKRMYQEGMPLGKIARCVQLDGGRYTVFQQVCREERLDMKKARGR